MNDFLERIKYYIKNDSSLINPNFIYSQLVTYNLGNNSIPLENMEHLFEDWIFRNRNRDNLQTFVSEKYPYFCQFANRDAINIANKAIKLYIPLDERHLYEGANKLFDFIAREGIHHNSKIGKQIRNDNVVVRVSNMEEALKVIEFVKNDPYIQNGLLKTNPFTLNINGVGIAKDGMRSYNVELCNHLGKFINILVNNNRLDDLNVDTFHEYLDSVKDFGDKDLHIITKLQSEITSGRKLNIEDFVSIINGNNLEMAKNSKKDVLKNAIRRTYDKYGLNHTKNALARFRYNGDTSGFTRDGGIRYNLEINVKLDDVNDIISNLNISSGNILEDYIKRVVGLNNDMFTVLENAYKETFNKYGNRQANIALERYILYGDYKHITNNNSARDNIKQIDYNSVINIIKKGLNIDAYCTNEELCSLFLDEMENKYLRNNSMRY